MTPRTASHRSPTLIVEESEFWSASLHHINTDWRYQRDVNLVVRFALRQNPWLGQFITHTNQGEMRRLSITADIPISIAYVIKKEKVIFLLKAWRHD